jgi:hypothetical protein
VYKWNWDQRKKFREGMNESSYFEVVAGGQSSISPEEDAQCNNEDDGTFSLRGKQQEGISSSKSA